MSEKERLQRELLELLQQKEKIVKYSQIDEYYKDDGKYRRELYPKHLDFMFSGKDYPERAFIAANRVGKAQPITQVVHTTNGFKQLKAIKVGDKVIGSSGKPIEVTGVFPQGIRPVYELEFTDGSKVQSDEDHLWTFSYSGRTSFQTKPLKEWLNIKTSKYVPQRPCIEVGHDNVPLEPYLLGLLIGDGCLVNKGVSISSADEEIIEYCRAIAPQFNCKLKYAGAYDYRFTSQIRSPLGYGKNELLDIIRELGLDCLSYDKFIPDVYKSANSKIRLALLQGLIDTDGWISKAGRVFFNSVSRQLCVDVLNLSRSLGINSRFKKRKVGYEVYLPYSKLPLCRLQRKLNRQAKEDTSTKVTVKNIKRIKDAECVCIAVNSEDSLYLTTDYILTHNTLTGGVELVYHITGRYPSWWRGKRFNRPIKAWVGSITPVQMKDAVQAVLFGSFADKGTGLIPKEDLTGDEGEIRTWNMPGVPNVVGTALVRHHDEEGNFDGWSTIEFKTYEQGWEKWQGSKIDVVWLDEEPKDHKIYSEASTRTAGDTGDTGILYCTFTPLLGFSDTVLSFLPGGKLPPNGINPETPWKKVINAGWDDVPHIDKDWKAQRLASYSTHERDARSKGIPTKGSGSIYPVGEDQIVVEPFVIPPFWKKAFGMDFGWVAPTACIWGAKDPESGVIYLYSEHYLSRTTPPIHAEAIKQRGDWIVGACDPAGLQEKSEHGSLVHQYVSLGVDLFPSKGGPHSKEVRISKVLTLMESGLLKVFNTLHEWLAEFRVYRRDENGKIVDKDDHLMDATLYLISEFDYIAAEMPDPDDRQNDDTYVDIGSGRSEVTGY